MSGGYAKFWIDPLELDISERLKVQELAKAEDLIRENETLIRRKWHEVFD